MKVSRRIAGSLPVVPAVYITHILIMEYLCVPAVLISVHEAGPAHGTVSALYSFCSFVSAWCIARLGAVCEDLHNAACACRCGGSSCILRTLWSGVLSVCLSLGSHIHTSFSPYSHLIHTSFGICFTPALQISPEMTNDDTVSVELDAKLP